MKTYPSRFILTVLSTLLVAGCVSRAEIEAVSDEQFGGDGYRQATSRRRLPGGLPLDLGAQIDDGPDRRCWIRGQLKRATRWH